MKLLASLVAAASADYACCPYDEFGVVFAGCPLSEKTPWAIDPTNSNAADPHGVEHHMCKAWEVRKKLYYDESDSFIFSFFPKKHEKIDNFRIILLKFKFLLILNTSF